MATAETVDLGPAHPPKEESITVFSAILPEIKKKLVHLRHEYNSMCGLFDTNVRQANATDPPEHEPEYFASVEHLSNNDLVGFTVKDVESVRVAQSAYGIHLFAKLRIPALPADGPAYIHFRAFTAGSDEPHKLHCIHTEEKEEQDGGKTYRAIFNKNDELEWFDT
ncbi:hypothetical protein B0J13DRAFT_122477 [Dactylonectria estremocensis]|uniref:Uncharacterized protein n=1 Tax=Dactylonectria estremocensis TaxID=1079267 RepID=A0A9P9FEU3_9HYPO|nr:hypothetical protein B0J13DRAFT_122477 [Dactylonectria estremocensis]